VRPRFEAKRSGEVLDKHVSGGELAEAAAEAVERALGDLGRDRGGLLRGDDGADVAEECLAHGRLDADVRREAARDELVDAEALVEVGVVAGAGRGLLTPISPSQRVSASHTSACQVPQRPITTSVE
jgi:hypothetical protein